MENINETKILEYFYDKLEQAKDTNDLAKIQKYNNIINLIIKPIKQNLKSDESKKSHISKKMKRKIAIKEVLNPDQCFCEQNGLNPVRDNNDDILFYSKEDYLSYGKQPYCKCKLCGKAYYAGVIIVC